MIEEEINKKLILVKTLITHVYDILKLFDPLIKRMLELDEAKKYNAEGTFRNAAAILEEISNICRKIEGSSLPSKTFLENLKN